MSLGKRIGDIFFLGFNVIMTIFGIFSIYIGVLAIRDVETLTNMVTRFKEEHSESRLYYIELDLSSLAAYVFPPGIIFTCVGFLGFFGYMRQHVDTLEIYCKIVLLLLAMEVILVVYVGVRWRSIVDDGKEKVRGSIKYVYDGYVNSTSLIGQVIDMVQYYFGCCGVDNYTNFKYTLWYNRTNRIGLWAVPPSELTGNMTTNGMIKPSIYHAFPETCCDSPHKSLSKMISIEPYEKFNVDCYMHNASAQNVNTMKGCGDQIQELFMNEIFLVLSIAGTVFGVQITAYNTSKDIATEIEKTAEKELASETERVTKTDNSAKGDKEEGDEIDSNTEDDENAEDSEDSEDDSDLLDDDYNDDPDDYIV